MVGGNRLRVAEKAMCLIRLFAFLRVGNFESLMFSFPLFQLHGVFVPRLWVTDDYKRSMTVGNIPSYILLPTGVPLVRNIFFTHRFFLWVSL